MPSKRTMPPLEWSQFSNDPNERREQYVMLFGSRLMKVRKNVRAHIQRLVESAEAREQMGTISRAPYEKCAGMSDESRVAALELSLAAVDSFAHMFVYMLGGHGISDRIDENHALNWKVIAEVTDIDADEVIEEIEVNRSESRFFGDYWGRWLNLEESEGPKAGFM